MSETPTIDDGGRAFPRLYARADEDGRSGMTLRDYFAAGVVAGMMAQPGDEFGIMTFESRATWAYQQADAMLQARKAT